MRYEESNARQRSKQYLRTVMDIIMGLFYMGIGGLLIFGRSFAGMTVPPLVAWVLGGMMLIGGGFRLYRGLKFVLSRKQ